MSSVRVARSERILARVSRLLDRRRPKIVYKGDHQARRRSWTVASAGLTGFLAAGCNVTESRGVYTAMGDVSKPACVSSLGSYSLPKTLLKVVVTRTAPSAEERGAAAIVVSAVRRADPNLTACLDHLGTVLSEDTIKITKGDGESGSAFLKAVFVNANDRMVRIVTTLLQGAFTIASGSAGFSRALYGDVGGKLADIEFDPFDRNEAARANMTLNAIAPDRKFCVLVPGFTNGGGQGFDSFKAYCNNPATARHMDGFVEAYARFSSQPLDDSAPGILYRPREPHRIVILQKLRGQDWAVSKIQNEQFENLSPVLSLDIKRSAFAQRQSVFVFQQGALVTACVSKGSEVEEFVKIPLYISKSLVALPGAIATVRIGAVGNETDLIKAQTAALQAQQAAIQSLLTGGVYSGPSNIKDPAATTAAKLEVEKIVSDLPDNDPPPVPSDTFFKATAKLCEAP